MMTITKNQFKAIMKKAINNTNTNNHNVEKDIEKDIAYNAEVNAYREAINNHGVLHTNTMARSMWDIRAI